MNTNISVYQMLYILCLFLSASCFLAAGYFFLTRNIPEVIGYLTGRNERKMIQKIERNIQSGNHPAENKFEIVKEIILIPTEEFIGEGGWER